MGSSLSTPRSPRSPRPGSRRERRLYLVEQQEALQARQRECEIQAFLETPAPAGRVIYDDHISYGHHDYPLPDQQAAPVRPVLLPRPAPAGPATATPGSAGGLARSYRVRHRAPPLPRPGSHREQMLMEQADVVQPSRPSRSSRESSPADSAGSQPTTVSTAPSALLLFVDPHRKRSGNSRFHEEL